MRRGPCEECSNYIYDEEYDCFFCQIGLDEDEMAAFMLNQVRECPYYRFNDEYYLASKQ